MAASMRGRMRNCPGEHGNKAGQLQASWQLTSPAKGPLLPSPSQVAKGRRRQRLKTEAAHHFLPHQSTRAAATSSPGASAMLVIMTACKPPHRKNACDHDCLRAATPQKHV
jgi:hypothetical protein